MARPVNPKWRELVLEACSRKSLILLEDLGYPRKFDQLLVACEHHPGGRKVLVSSIINARHCCRTGNARSESGRQQRARTLTRMWDDPVKRLPLLRNTSGHIGPHLTKLYICKLRDSNNEPVLKIGRSIRGAHRFGSSLVEQIWDCDAETSKARVVELYTHLKFSDYLLDDVELSTSGYTECYHISLPVDEVVHFIQQSLSEVK